jgi:hypothetical protein
MRIKYYLIIILGILACILILDDIVPQPFVSHDSNLVYALGRHPRPNPGPPSNDDPPIPVPEPSTLILLGTGITGVGSYLYYKHRKGKK